MNTIHNPSTQNAVIDVYRQFEAGFQQLGYTSEAKICRIYATLNKYLPDSVCKFSHALHLGRISSEAWKDIHMSMKAKRLRNSRTKHK